MKLQVQQKSIRLSRTIQPFPLRGVLAPNLCLLTLLHSSPSDSGPSFQNSYACSVLHVLLIAAVGPCFYMTTGKAAATRQSFHSCLWSAPSSGAKLKHVLYVAEKHCFKICFAFLAKQSSEVQRLKIMSNVTMSLY